MDHAEVRERLEGAVLSPGKLGAIETDVTPLGAEVRAHLASCAVCSSELRALRETASLLALAAPDDMHAPGAARDAVLRAIRETGVRRAIPLKRPTRAAWLGLAAAIALLLVAVALALQLRAQRDDALADVRELGAVASTSDRLLRDPQTKTAVLHDKAGRTAGTVTYNVARHEIVVVSDALPPPPAGGRYDCLIGQSDQWNVVGWMHYSNGLAYWAGDVGTSFTASGTPGSRLIVQLHNQVSDAAIWADL